jgi:hypothetical protein
MKEKHYRHKTHSTNYSAVSSLASPGESHSFLDTIENEVLECNETSDEISKFQEIITSYLQLNERNEQVNTRCLKVLSKENKIISVTDMVRSKTAYFRELSLLKKKNKLLRQKAMILDTREKFQIDERKKLRGLIEEYNWKKTDYTKKLELFQKINEKQQVASMIQKKIHLLKTEKKKIFEKKEKIERKRKKIFEMINRLRGEGIKTGEMIEIPVKYLQASFAGFSEVDTTCERSSSNLTSFQSIDSLNSQIKELSKVFNEKVAANQRRYQKIQNSTQTLKNHQKTLETLKNSHQNLMISINSFKSKLKSDETLLKNKEILLKAKKKYLKKLESDLYDRFSILFHTFK